MTVRLTMILNNWPAPLRSALFKLLGVHWAHQLLDELAADKPTKQELLERIFARNNFNIRVTGAEKIPRNRGCLFASNHPHGLFLHENLDLGPDFKLSLIGNQNLVKDKTCIAKTTFDLKFNRPERCNMSEYWSPITSCLVQWRSETP